MDEGTVVDDPMLVFVMLVAIEEEDIELVEAADIDEEDLEFVEED